MPARHKCCGSVLEIQHKQTHCPSTVSVVTSVAIKSLILGWQLYHDASVCRSAYGRSYLYCGDGPGVHLHWPELLQIGTVRHHRHNFDKCWPIFKILLLSYSLRRNSCHTLSVSLHLRNTTDHKQKNFHVYIGMMIIKASKRIFNSGKICRSYSDLNFGVTFFGTQLVGKLASEEVMVQLLKHNCLPILLYALEVCNGDKRILQSFDFTVNRFFKAVQDI